MQRSKNFRIREWLGLEPNIVVMLVSTLIVELGEELWKSFVPKYLEYFGATALMIALYGTLKDLLDALYQYPGGWVADRFGRKKSLQLFTLLGIIGYAIYMLADNWLWILAGTVFVMAWSSLTLPGLFAMIADNLPRQRRAIGFGIKSILKRVPAVIAPVIGGAFIMTMGLEVGIRTGLAITIGLAFLSFVIMHRYYREEKALSADKLRLAGIWNSMDPYLKRLLVSDCMARWAEGIPKVFIVLYVMNILKVDAFRFGWLTALQTMSAIVFYLPTSKLADRLNRKPFVLLTFAFFALFPLMIATSHQFFGLVTAFIVGGLREIGEPARKALIVDLSKESTIARAVGLYYFIRGLVVFPASLAGGWLWQLDPNFPFYVAFVIGAVGCIIYALSGKDKKAEKDL